MEAQTDDVFQGAELPGMSMREIQALCDHALPDKRAIFRHYMDVAMVINDSSTRGGGGGGGDGNGVVVGMSMREIQALCDHALPDKRALFRHYMDVAMVINYSSTHGGGGGGGGGGKDEHERDPSLV